MLEVNAKFLFDIYGEFEDPILIDPIPHGHITIMYLKGGTFEGPEMKGVVLPGGGDWHLTRADGVGELDVRATIRTDEGDYVYIQGRGYMHYPAEVGERWGRGETVDPSDYYFRVGLFFETNSKKFAWLNQTIGVGVAGFTEKGVLVKYYAIV